MEPNIQYWWGNIETPAYYAEVYLAGLPSPLPGTRTLVVQEKFNGYGINQTLAFYTRSFDITK
ncbi:hypothetical protein Moror_2578 [Moniliophthora roreri MCA 2997]|uniref:Uncharacterized protein n=2 Tax=Moniliophthora roreri TaxID=221103 RepID=V2YIK1_MONRO|nr:hypothetical protein Moror_2578 [Moniliophthora roreri MCA 2997]KAI3619452.1 hypothetical protein WG66_013022 [Moniliophthora roreri]